MKENPALPTAVMLVFNPGIPHERIQKWIEAVSAKGVLASGANMAQFDPETTGATLYFP